MDYVTPTENVQIGDHKKNWYGEIYFLNLGNICKWPIFINYQILMFKYDFIIIFVKNLFDKLAT